MACVVAYGVAYGVVLMAAGTLAGCADASRNLYEGIRQLRPQDPNAAQPALPQPDYEQYRREREALKKG